MEGACRTALLADAAPAPRAARRQNDFLPAADAPDGGRFGVAEGASAVPTMIALINKFVEAEAGCQDEARRKSEKKALVGSGNEGEQEGELSEPGAE